MTRKSNHTPGPWTVDGTPQNQIVWSGQQNRVCFLAHSDGTNDARDLANGKLIAAAPEMYEALQSLAQILKAVSYSMTLGTTSVRRLQAARELLDRLEGKA